MVHLVRIPPSLPSPSASPLAKSRLVQGEVEWVTWSEYSPSSQNRRTDMHENITFPRTTYVVGKNAFWAPTRIVITHNNVVVM